MKACLCCVVMLAAFLCSMSSASEDVFLLSYFTGNGETGVYLAASEEGLTFKDLNEGRPIFTPPPWVGQNLTRNPSIVYHDGAFHMVWTSNWNGSASGPRLHPI